MGEDQQYIVTRDELAKREGLSKTHFLNPNAKRINKSLGDWTGLTQIGVHWIEVPPGADSTEFHVHHHEDEAVYILEGKAEAVIGERIVAVGPGDFIGYRAGGEAHMLRNVGDGPLRCLVVGNRGSTDVADYPRQGKRLWRNRGLDWDLADHVNVSHPKAGKKV